MCEAVSVAIWQTFSDQELLLIFTESSGPPHILIFLVAYGKTQDIYNNNILILVIRSKIKFRKLEENIIYHRLKLQQK
jgi:hypothetical protein